MELALALVTFLGSALGLWLWYAKKEDLTEKQRQEKIDALEKLLEDANERVDYFAMRNITRQLNRLRK